jgi:membrane-anchored glycerophosphoryl diester phosphodiesterase (GDPDase)
VRGCIGFAIGIIFLQNYLTDRSNKWLLLEAIRAGIGIYGSLCVLVFFFLSILVPLSLILALSGRYFINYCDAQEILYIVAMLLMVGLCGKSIFLIPAVSIQKRCPSAAIRESWQLSTKAMFKLLIIQITALKLLSITFSTLKTTPYLLIKLTSGALGIILIIMVMLWLITTYNLQKKDIHTI